MSDSDGQGWSTTHGLEPALVLAPPGCGKTEHLARWTSSVVARGLLTSPRKVLALTYSNKAKANLRSRLQAILGPRWYRHAIVTNFHGFAYRVYQHHAGAIDRMPLEIGPQRGWLRALTNQVLAESGADRDELALTLRRAKCGPYDDGEVMNRLEAVGMPAAIDYELALRQADRVDYDDVIRLGHLVLRTPQVSDLYRCAFAAVIVDEVQDLSLGQLALVKQVGAGRTIFAGDTAQGIYGFAGAEPAAVLSAIRSESPVEYRLESSYRSSPAVLKVVSSLAAQLGGTNVTSAIPDEWVGRGTVRLLRTSDVSTEAHAVVSLVTAWQTTHPAGSIAVISRTGARRRTLDQVVRDAGIDAENWDFPTQRPLVANLLARHVDLASLMTSPEEVLQDLFNRCFVDIDESDLDSLDELQDALEAISELLAEGHKLSEVVRGIRVASTVDEPVGPGLHLLNGHLGKGQQFDRVIVLGLEEAILPHYAAMLAERRGDGSQILEELAVLHVMASRAREDLVMTVASSVPNAKGATLDREPSRFLRHVIAHVTEEVDLR